MLDSSIISGLLKYECKIFTDEVTESTNTDALRLISDGNVRFITSAETQTHGRGRDQKSFFSPAETGLYFSYVIPCSSVPESKMPLSCLIAVSVCKSIEKFCDVDLKIKWVNDVYFKEKKVCGILIERKNVNNEDYYIIGIGINITTVHFPDELSNIAGSLGFQIERELLLAEIINNIDSLNDGTLYSDEYILRSNLIGRQIMYYIDNNKYSGTVLGINSTGGLLVDNGIKVEILTSGIIDF